MHSKYLLVNDGSNWETIETIGEGLPQLDIVTSLAFIIKPVYAVDGGAFVITTEDEKVFWIFDFICQQQANRLQRLLASIHVVT